MGNFLEQNATETPSEGDLLRNLPDSDFAAAGFVVYIFSHLTANYSKRHHIQNVTVLVLHDSRWGETVRIRESTRTLNPIETVLFDTTLEIFHHEVAVTEHPKRLSFSR